MSNGPNLPPELAEKYLSFFREADGDLELVDKTGMLSFVAEHASEYPALLDLLGINQNAVIEHFQKTGEVVPGVRIIHTETAEGSNVTKLAIFTDRTESLKPKAGAVAPPKVFISHAGEDKDRFVLGFASRLRAKGIDAWLDKWEMRPGDKLLDKIFDEGIRNAQAIIAIISKNSVDKPWVKEEMDAAFVKRVNQGSKLIPIVIDDCQVPEILKTTLWEPIKDLANYDASFDRVVESIFGVASKPPLGAAPSYVSVDLIPIAGINKTDTLVLKCSCELVIDRNRNLIHASEYPVGSIIGEIPAEVLQESLEILEHHYYVKQSKHLGPGPYSYRITDAGFEEYCQAFFPGYQEAVKKACFELVNNKPKSNQELQGRLNVPLAVVDHILGNLERRDHILMGGETGDYQHIVDVRVTLKRAIEDMAED